MAYQPLGQVAVDYCAIVIYGLCHRIIIFFEADLLQIKTIQFATDFILFPPPPHFSTLQHTISNKSQSFVFLSPSFLCFSQCWDGLWGLQEDRGRGGRASALELWAEGLSELRFRQTDDLQALCLQRGRTALFTAPCVALINSLQWRLVDLKFTSRAFVIS